MADKRVLATVPFALDDEGIALRKAQLVSLGLTQSRAANPKPHVYVGDMIRGMLDGGARVQQSMG